MKSIALAIVGIMLAGTAAAQTAQEQAQILRDFQQRVADYAHRERCIGHVAPETAAREQIFTLPVAMVFRQVIAEALAESATATWMQAPADTLPLADHPVALQPFPATELHDFPPLLSHALPPLPRSLEYRLIGSDLVLRDVDEGVIVGVLREALGALPAARR